MKELILFIIMRYSILPFHLKLKQNSNTRLNYLTNIEFLLELKKHFNPFFLTYS